MKPLCRQEAFPTYPADPGFFGSIAGDAIPRQIGINTILRSYTWTAQTNEREPLVTLYSKVFEGLAVGFCKNLWVNIETWLDDRKTLRYDGC
jgi:hypothetical protein